MCVDHHFYCIVLSCHLAYISEVEASIDFVRHSPNISIEEKRRFFKSANRNVGSSALCLSGGATFGYCGLGLIAWRSTLTKFRSFWRHQGSLGLKADA